MGVIFHLLLLALATFVSASAQGSGGSTCTQEPSTLSNNCGGICGEYEPCVVYNASDSDTCSNCTPDSSGVCTYFCFTLDNQATGDYSVTLLILFGDYQSEQEIYERSIDPNFDSLVDSVPDDTNLYSYSTNSVLTNIKSMALQPDTNSVTIAGGTTPDYVVKSKVVDVDLAQNLFENTTSLTKVTFINMNLEKRIADLPTLLPPNLLVLSLSNTLQTSFPSNLNSLMSLEKLYLNFNYITSVTSNDTLESAKYLWLESNELTSFEGYFPNIIGLDLYDNNLTEIPAAVFKLSTLQQLYIDKNPLVSATFTSSQVAFLQGLTNLDLNKGSFLNPLDCDASLQVAVHSNLTVCVSDGGNTNGTATSDDDANTKGDDDGDSTNTALIIGIVAGVVVLVLGIVIACLWYRRQRNKDKDEHAQTTISGGTTSTAYVDIAANNHSLGISGSNQSYTHRAVDPSALWNDPTLLSLKVQTEEIQDVMKIGNGAYGVVWLVKYRNSQLLASKRIQKDHITKEKTQDFIDEIKLVATFDHPNIVKFIGIAWTTEHDLQALFEYMKNGDLREYLIDPNTNREWTAEKLQIAVDIVEALVYVHSFQPPLVHRDLKSRNVLLTGNMRAKLTDFGVSRFRSQDNTMTSGVGTGRWLAPEVIMGSTDYGAPADIYSFGVVLSELDTHNVPYGDARTTTGNPLADVAILKLVADGDLRPSFRRSCPQQILELADQCLAHNPTERPTAPQLAYALRTLQKSLF